MNIVQSLPENEETIKLAKRIVWFKKPSETLNNILHLGTYILANGTHEDITIFKKYVGHDGMCEILKNALPGIIDERSWHYWNLVLLNEYEPKPQKGRNFS